MMLRWEGDREMERRMGEYAGKVEQAVKAVADYFAPVIESYAKSNAPWSDQTGNARQSLHAFTEELARDTVALYLAHGVEYGVFLELANQGKYAIVLPALEAHYVQVGKALKDIFGR